MRQYGRMILLYAACFLYIMLVYVTIQSNSTQYHLFADLSSHSGLLSAYLFSTLQLSLGILLFHFIYQHLSQQQASPLLAMVAFLSLGGLGLIHSSSFPVCLAGILLTMLTCGCLMGAVFYTLLLQVPESYMGRVLASAMVLTTLAQFLVQSAAARLMMLPFIPGTACFILLYFLHLLHKTLQEYPLAVTVYAPSRQLQKLTGHYLPILLLTAILLSLMHGVNEGILLALYAHQAVDLYGLPRLFTLPGFLAAGLLADYQGRRFLPLAVLLTMTMRIFCLLLFHHPATWTLSLCLAYFCSAFFVLFITIIFLDAAPRAQWPSLWAGMGRLIELPCASIGALLGGVLWLSVSLGEIIGIYTLLLLIILLLFHISTAAWQATLQQALSPLDAAPDAGTAAVCPTAPAANVMIPFPAPTSVPAPEPSLPSCSAAPPAAAAPIHLPPDAAPPAAPLAAPAAAPLLATPEPADLAHCQQLYALTARETEVLRHIIAGQSAKDIAARLAISERTVKYHTSNILHKAGVRTQKELLLLLYTHSKE